MKFKFCSIRKNVTKYDVTFAAKRKGSNLQPFPRGYAAGVKKKPASLLAVSLCKALNGMPLSTFEWIDR